MKVAQPKQVMEWMNWICAASRKYRVSRSLPLRLPQIQMIIARQPLTAAHRIQRRRVQSRSEEHTSELQSLMRISYAVFCLKKKNIIIQITREWLQNSMSRTRAYSEDTQ